MNLLNLITLNKKKTFYIKYLYNNCKVYSSIKKEETHERLFDSIDINSLELYAEMMRDRYGFRHEDK
jgi:hypothetical protein